MNKKFPAQFHFARLPVRCWNPAIIGDRSRILQLFPGFHAKKTVFRQTNCSPVSLFGKFSHLLWPLCGISATQPPRKPLDTEKPQATNRSDNKTKPRLSPGQSRPRHSTDVARQLLCNSPSNCRFGQNDVQLVHSPTVFTQSPVPDLQHTSRFRMLSSGPVHRDHTGMVSTTISCNSRGCSRKRRCQHLSQFHGRGVRTIFPGAGQQTSVLFT